MAAVPTKNQKIEALVKLVQKRSRGLGLPQPQQRSMLDTLMYAALLENTTYDKADIAFAVLENHYIDWNEIRVCSLRELADTLVDLPQPEAAAERIRKSLQRIFEKTYTFDLEDLCKKGKALSEHMKTIESVSAGTPFMIQYVAQVTLDGHVIPLDEASLRIMRRLNLSQISSDGTQEICVGLDRVILKKTSLTFSTQLHHFSAEYYDVPDSPELLSLLCVIDPGVVSRSWEPPILALSVARPVSSVTPSVSAAKSATPSVVRENTDPSAVTLPLTASSVTTSDNNRPKETVKSRKDHQKIIQKPDSDPREAVKPATKGKFVSVKKVVKKSGKVSPSGQAVSKQSVKPALPKKKVLIKKAPAKKTGIKLSGIKKTADKKGAVKMIKKPIKRGSAVSASKSLRKKKPK